LGVRIDRDTGAAIREPFQVAIPSAPVATSPEIAQTDFSVVPGLMLLSQSVKSGDLWMIENVQP
jgi:hypothetical protein